MNSIVSFDGVHRFYQSSFRVNAQSNYLRALQLRFNFSSVPAVPKATLISDADDGAIFKFVSGAFRPFMISPAAGIGLTTKLCYGIQFRISTVTEEM